MARRQGSYDHVQWAREEARRRQRAEAAGEKAAERERKLQESAAGKAEAERLNAELADLVARLDSILRRGLDREAAIDLNTMVRHFDFPPLNLAPYGVALRRPAWSNYAPPEPSKIAGIFGGNSRHERRLAAAREAFARAELDYERSETERQEWVGEQTSRHEAAFRAHEDEVTRHNSRIAEIAAGLRDRDRESVQRYLELVLSRTLLPDDVPRHAEVAYSPPGEQVVVRFALPPVEVVPVVDSYTYVATTATLREKKRPMAEIAQLYRSIVSQITLLYMRDLFESDADLDNVELGGHVRAVNPATGQLEYPCLISIATDRATYFGAQPA